MSWVAIVLIVLGIFIAIKVAGALLKLCLWLAIGLALWWLLHPYLGMPLIPF